MSVEKVIENGMTYRVESEGSTVVKMMIEPRLAYQPVRATVTSGDVLSIPMELQDFDGEPRTENQQVTFLVDGQQVPVALTGGKLTLELELVARGRHRIALIPAGISMQPIELEVV